MTGRAIYTCMPYFLHAVLQLGRIADARIAHVSPTLSFKMLVSKVLIDTPEVRKRKLATLDPLKAKKPVAELVYGIYNLARDCWRALCALGFF